MFSVIQNSTKQIMKRGTCVSTLRQLSNVSGLLEVLQQDGVRTLTLDDPKTRNSLSLAMVEGLHSALTAEDPKLRCVVIKARGPVFSAGHNLKHIHASERPCHTGLFESCARLMLSVRRLEVPVVAVVDGVAAAAGCQLVAACDMALASDTSKFSTPGASVGIFCSTPGIPLVRCVPRKVSAHMLLTGLPITADEALRAGLVSVVVPSQQLEAETEKVVSSILSKSKAVVALGKRFMYQQMEMTEEEAYSAGSRVMVENINTPDGREGVDSFVTKRKPNWGHE